MFLGLLIYFLFFSTTENICISIFSVYFSYFIFGLGLKENSKATFKEEFTVIPMIAVNFLLNMIACGLTWVCSIDIPRFFISFICMLIFGFIIRKRYCENIIDRLKHMYGVCFLGITVLFLFLERLIV